MGPSAKQQSGPVELLGAATESTRYWRYPDGHISAEAWSRPVRVQKSGAWAWIDTTLAEQEGRISPKVIKGDLSLPSGGSGSEVTFTPTSQQSFSMQWPTDLPKPKLEGSRAIYADAAGQGADLVVTALATGFRYDVVLRNRPAKALEIKLPFHGPGLALRKEANGLLRASTNDKQNLVFGSRPYLTSLDNAGTQRPHIGTVATDISTNGGQQTINLRPDQKYLEDPSTTYPVTLQSAFSLTASSDADIWSATPDWSYPDGATLKAGTESDGTKSRAYLKFDTSALIGQQISNVTLSMLNIDGPSCGATVGDGIQVRRITGAWTPDTVTWSAQPTNTTTDAVINKSSIGGSCDPAPMTWDVTAIAQQWAADAGNYGLVLMSPTERASANYRVFTSTEDSDFNNPPKLTATFAPLGEPTVLYPAGPDGVEVIQPPAHWGSDSVQMAEPQAQALSSAYDRVEANGDTLADPYVDMVSGNVIVPAVTADGHPIGEAALTGTAYLGIGSVDWTLPGEYTDGDTDEDSEGSGGQPQDYSFTPQVPDVARSKTWLTATAQEVLRLTAAQLPGADNVLAARLWGERNQVLLIANAVSPELRQALAQRYGVDGVVIALDPAATKAETLDSRGNDNDAYINGGGGYKTDNEDACTMGFAWSVSGAKRLVTAGHCMPTNDSTTLVYSLQGGLGVTAPYGHKLLSNWTVGTGTVPLPGQNKWLGDVALVETTAPTQPTASIFVGGATSGSKREVKRSWPRRSVNGDLFCVGGAVSGQHCTWKVENANTWMKTNTGTLDNTVTASRSRDCVQHGDSGGPVYTLIPDPAGAADVAAKGIISSGKDPWFGDCILAFTDITTVRQAFDGDVMKRK